MFDNFSILLQIAMISGGLILFPFYATLSGLGISSERDNKIINSVNSEVTTCPVYQQDIYGKCRKTYRSYFGGRSIGGGGPNFGK
jgi:hypothetical protein